MKAVARTRRRRVILLTGCRPGEMGRLRWCEVKPGKLILADTKTGPRHVLLGRRRGELLFLIQPRHRANGCFPISRRVNRLRLVGLLLNHCRSSRAWRRVAGRCIKVFSQRPGFTPDPPHESYRGLTSVIMKFNQQARTLA